MSVSFPPWKTETVEEPIEDDAEATEEAEKEGDEDEAEVEEEEEEKDKPKTKKVGSSSRSVKRDHCWDCSLHVDGLLL